jgi:hypothetical protein
MRLTKAELDAISTALAELLAGEGPQGAEDQDEGQRIMDAAATAHEKIIAEIGRRTKHGE